MRRKHHIHVLFNDRVHTIIVDNSTGIIDIASLYRYLSDIMIKEYKNE